MFSRLLTGASSTNEVVLETREPPLLDCLQAQSKFTTAFRDSSMTINGMPPIGKMECQPSLGIDVVDAAQLQHASEVNGFVQQSQDFPFSVSSSARNPVKDFQGEESNDIKQESQPSKSYHYDYKAKRWFCDLDGKSYAKKTELENHRWREHGITERVDCAKRGRQPNDPFFGPIRKRDSSGQILQRAFDPEHKFEQQIRQGRIRWRAQAEKISNIVCVDGAEISGLDKASFIEKFVAQREELYRQEKVQRIAKIEEGIKQRYGYLPANESIQNDRSQHGTIKGSAMANMMMYDTGLDDGDLKEVEF